ncbi:MAG TPA: GSCFA domain-containing protein [Chitinophagaceae bacterium]|nr:GSCFA domain-containing protein [Chitinophagaceae bacterium]
MDFMLNIEMAKWPRQIHYQDKILLIGSCFTEHIGNTLEELKFSVLQNPNGILFDPLSVCKSLISYADNKHYTEADLFELNELWHSWQHHSRFSNTDKDKCLLRINESQTKAHDFLKTADWIIITLGSSFLYRLTGLAKFSKNSSLTEGEKAVANCHRAPSQWFDKHMMEIDEIISKLEDCIFRLLEFNSKLKIIFTVSPVRHIRDGVIENNRSKARLIESAHHLINKYEQLYYFPAYELVIDILRDYRFYDIDLVHPNYMATEFVLEKFSASCMEEGSGQLMKEVKKIIIARKHKPFQPGTKAHQQFLRSHYEKTKALAENHPFLDLKEELTYFSQI